MRSDRRMTLDEITVRRALPRTTVWSWIENLPVPRAEFDPRPATTLGAEPVRPTRAGTGSCAGRRTSGALPSSTSSPAIRCFATSCAYIAEGYKRDRNRVAVGNSDPAVVSLCARWLGRCLPSDWDRPCSTTPTRIWSCSGGSGRRNSRSSPSASSLNVSPIAGRCGDEPGEARMECSRCGPVTPFFGRGCRGGGWTASELVGPSMHATGRGAVW